MGKYLLIFDLDGTIFNTDFLRNKRRTNIYSVNDEDFLNVKLIDGFQNIFLDEKKDLFLEDNKVLFITSANEQYAHKLFKNGLPNLDLRKYNLITSCNSNNKIEAIKRFISLNFKSNMKILAFGDDEKDALIYSLLDIDYFIVNNYYGYNNYKYFLNEIHSKSDVRTQFIHDIVKINNDFKSEFFDDVVVYYKFYYDKREKEIETIYLDKNNCLNIPGSFANDKSGWIKNNISQIVRFYLESLDINKNICFAKVPGHDELEYNNNSPCSILIKELCKYYGEDKDYSDLLLKKEITNPLAGRNKAERNVEEIKKSIFLNRKIKGKTIYLFDDIATTCTSMIACSQLLYENGAGHVVCLPIARTKYESNKYQYNRLVNKMIDNEKINKFILFLKCLKNVGDKFIRNLMLKYSNNEMINIIEDIHNNDDIRNFFYSHLELFPRKLKFYDLFTDSNINSAKEKRKEISKMFKYITWYDYKYFRRFQTMYETQDFPVLLFYKGDIELLNFNKICAVIGTREPSNETIYYAKNIIQHMINQGYVILSGLALGCDTIAHEECLRLNGKTISIFGTGIDEIYPKNNDYLAKTIEHNGLILSEYLPGFKGASYSFISRDRLQAAASDVVIALETSETGGTMHAVNSAIKYGKKIYVLSPNIIPNGNYSGNLKLINENLAISIENIDSIK